MSEIKGADLRRWRGDPICFVDEVLRNPDTGEPFALYPAQVDFLRAGFTLTKEGTLPFPDMAFGAIKKTGKTTTAGMGFIYTIVVLGGPFAEGYCCANDLDQSQGRVFQATARIIQASPLLANAARITGSKIEFPSTGAIITALASDYAGAAGANPTITVFDELWAYVSERSHRLWDEMVPVPTRKVSVRLVVTYAGFEGESDLLEGLYKRGIQGEEIAPSLYQSEGLLMAWHHEPVAPWQTPAWLAQMRRQLRPNAYLRMIENRWVTTESTFVDMAWWDSCTDQDCTPILMDRSLPVYVGVDASVKHDSTAIVWVTFDHTARKVRLVGHRIFQPTPNDPLDFEAAIEGTLTEIQQRFRVQEIRVDPYQLIATAQRLQRAGLPMKEFPQSVPNLTEASTSLYDAIKGCNLIVYPDEQLRLSISRAVAVETSRGWRIAKEKASHKIDVVVALAQAVLGAVSNPGRQAGDYGWS